MLVAAGWNCHRLTAYYLIEPFGIICTIKISNKVYILNRDLGLLFSIQKDMITTVRVKLQKDAALQIVLEGFSNKTIGIHQLIW